MRRTLASKVNAILLGAPGGGKGTISKYLQRDYAFTHLSTGDMLRAHIRDETSIGKEVKGIMASGGLVSDALVLDMIAEEVKGKKNILFDGFPRTLEQAKALKDIVDIDMVVELKVPHQTIADRISNRWVHAPSGRVYSYDFNPPKVEGFDDETSEPLSQREDDKPEVVLNRLGKYEETTSALTEFYGSLGVLRSFAGTESKVIYADIIEQLDEELKKR
jgi:adenylate kinase